MFNCAQVYQEMDPTTFRLEFIFLSFSFSPSPSLPLFSLFYLLFIFPLRYLKVYPALSACGSSRHPRDLDDNGLVPRLAQSLRNPGKAVSGASMRNRVVKVVVLFILIVLVVTVAVAMGVAVQVVFCIVVFLGDCRSIGS